MYRDEYPRPQMVRKDYMSINGEWQFAFDDERVSQSERWERNDKTLPLSINVPFCYESKLSGIDDKSPHSIVFYKTKVCFPKEWSEKRILLHFGAVDYQCKVFINGYMVGEHEGGHTGFSFDITDYVAEGEQDISVYVKDTWYDETIPRGKQYWKEKSESIWYTRTTGIWQSVWLEPVSAIRIEEIRFTSDIDTGYVTLEAMLSEDTECMLEVEMQFCGKTVCKDIYSVNGKLIKRSIDIFQNEIFRTYAHNCGMCWSPEHPNLFDVTLKLIQNNIVLDEIESYFGMRKISTSNGKVYLNNRPTYLKLVLDQGYWCDGLMTAPMDEDFKKDILMSKEMGFNGCRKHQKVEDQRFLYWADRLGYLVWGEVGASAVYTNESAVRLVKEWTEIIKRDYNHPSIVAWVPLNESWGVSQIANDKCQQHHSLSLYHLIKSLDITRLVINNDGWEMTLTDICAIHNYNHGNDNESEKYEYFKKVLSEKVLLLNTFPAGRSIYINGFHHNGEPILLTEFGGIAYHTSTSEGWGYTMADNKEEFLNQFKRLFDAVKASSILAGYCYTQLTDVEQEINGLITYDRKFKCDPDKIKGILDETICF